MPHGGKRPGAGAPKGNLNGLKTGKHSIRLNAVLAAMAKMPELQEFMLNVERRKARHQKRAARLIRAAILELLQDITTRPDFLERGDNQIIAYLLATNGLAGKRNKKVSVNQVEGEQSSSS